jgi:hypothetical protein
MSPGGPVEVPLPEPMLRRPRFGPFDSVTDALKFLLALALGAVVAALTAPVAWLPFVGGGFLLATYRPEGKSIDERCGDYLRWRFRSLAGHRLRDTAASPGPLLRVDGALYGGLEVGGTPLAYLPEPEQAARFAAYRAVLDSLGGPLWMEVGSEPVRAGPFVPEPGPAVRAEESEPLEAYREMLLLLLRRRHRRRVRLLLAEPEAGAAAERRLTERLRSVGETLGRLELVPRRLRSSEIAALLRATPCGGP